MLSKSEKNRIKSLKEKEARHLQMEFVAEGSRIILDLINAAQDKLKLLCATPEWYAKFKPLLSKNEEKIRIISSSVLQSISSLKSNEEVLAVFGFPDTSFEKNDELSLIVYLDNMRDPGNLGTIIRSADWFGIQKIFCSPACVDPFNNKCIQATMSSIMRVEVIQKTWNEMINEYPDVEKYAAIINADSIYSLNKDEVNFICIGNESNGISLEILNQCNHRISIPSQYSLGAESLNAAVACSMIMAWKKFSK